MENCAHAVTTGVAGIWGPPDYGDPRPNITSDIGTGVTISLSDMRLPVVPIALAVWGSSVIWGSLALLMIEAELPSILDRGPYNLQSLANDLADFMYKMADIYKSLGSRLDSTKLR